MARNGPPMEKARRRARQPITSNRSTSTMPWSVIFRCGITGRHRKASCRNGSSSVTPSDRGGGAQRDQPVAHHLERLKAHQPRDGQRQFGQNPPPLDHDEPALDLPQPVRRQRHVGVIGAHHRDVVMVVADGRGDGAALQPEALDEARGAVAVHAVPLDHRDLHQIARDVGALVAVLRARCRRSDAR